jgi:hypothetical protein
MTVATGTQTDLFAWARELEQENKRIAEINGGRVRNRGYLVFATDSSEGVDSAEYQQVYATEARTPNQAIAKVRPLAEAGPSLIHGLEPRADTEKGLRRVQAAPTWCGDYLGLGACRPGLRS